MKNILMHILFVVIIIAELFGDYLDIGWMDYPFKPLLLIWIAAYFILNTRNIDKHMKKLVLLAFLFSWFGDILLMFPHFNTLFFIAGLLAFLVSHIYYILVLLKTVNYSKEKSYLLKRPIWILPFLIFGVVIYITLYNHLDVVLKVAVFIYMLALLSMAAMALNRHGNSRPVSFVLILIGALLFVASDSLIAINKFVVPIAHQGLWIMFTYIAAQYLIMRGILKQYE